MNKHCIVTHTGFNIDTNGRIGQCCLQKKEYLIDNFDDITDLNFWYNTESWLSEIRHSLDNNIEHSACSTCWHYEHDNKSSKRIRSNAVQQSNKTTIEHLDLRLSSKCNLECKMCFPGCSSQIEKLAIELEEKNIESRLDISNKNKPNLDIKKLLNLILKLPDIKTIRFAGGEPFIMPEVEEFLFKLAEVKTNISIEFITNCTVIKNKIIKVLEKFKHVLIMCSIDGIEDTIEYQRYPCKWSVIEKNFIKLYNSNFMIDLTPCITLFNYLDLHKLVNWANLFPNARLCYNEIINPSYLDFRIIPITARTRFYDTFKNISFINYADNWKTFQSKTMYDYRNPTEQEVDDLKHYSSVVWDYKCKEKFLDRYQWANSII